MCIIVFKPYGEKFPSKEILETCFTNNPDGAGFMYPLNYSESESEDIRIVARSKVVVHKGFMTFDDFWTALNKEFDNLEYVNCPVAIHFRIRTHGLADEGATQPIPISNKNKHLRATSIKCSCAMTHNGIIYDFCDSKSKLSDSQLFARDFLTVLKLYQDITAHKVELVKKAIGSTNKMILMNANGEYAMIGNFIFDNGCYYSNTSYKESYVYTLPVKTTYYGCKNYSDWYDDDYWYGFNGNQKKYSYGKMVKKEGNAYNKELLGSDAYDRYDL